jgi:hypothetical protein
MFAAAPAIVPLTRRRRFALSRRVLTALDAVVQVSAISRSAVRSTNL